MTRISTLVLSLTVLASTAAVAQRPTPPSPLPSPKVDAAPDISAKIIGTWQGPYQSDQAPPGGLKLVIAKEADEWKVTLQVQSDQPIDAAEVRDFTVDGNQISWVQNIMGMECKSIATLENGTLKGGSECSEGGAVSITATFVLLKQ